MPRAESPRNDEDRTARQSSESTDEGSSFTEGVTGWAAASTFRVGLALIGFVLLLFALGQIAGFDLLGLVVDALSTSTGRWLIVAIVALVLIVIAVRGFGRRPE